MDQFIKNGPDETHGVSKHGVLKLIKLSCANAAAFLNNLLLKVPRFKENKDAKMQQNNGRVCDFISPPLTPVNVYVRPYRHAFPAEPKRRIFSATTAFMASFAEVMTWMRSFLELLSESM